MIDSKQDRITILMVEDHPIYLEALRGYVEIRDDIFQLVGCADDIDEAIALVEQHVPNIVLLDLELHGNSHAGIEGIRQIRTTSPSTKVVVLTAHREYELIFPAIQAGAVTYLLKDNVRGPDIVSILQEVQDGNPRMDPQIAKILWAYFQQPATSLDQKWSYQEHLTGRESDVLRQIVDGKSNKEIAEELVISEKTVKTHVSNILQKLHLANRTELRMYAVIGLVQDNAMSR